MPTADAYNIYGPFDHSMIDAEVKSKKLVRENFNDERV